MIGSIAVEEDVFVEPEPVGMNLEVAAMLCVLLEPADESCVVIVIA